MKSKIRFWLTSFCIHCIFSIQSQEIQYVTIRGDFENLPQTGGHLQGVQIFESKQKEYIAVSGSSDSYAYYFVAEKTQDSIFELKYIRKIWDKPMKHAGGFQVAHSFLVVGVEDNEKKDSSLLVIYDISEPGISDIEPIKVVERGSKYKESTAGAAGAFVQDDTLICLVASWDAITVDRIDFVLNPQHDSIIKTVQRNSIVMKEIERFNEKMVWRPYQNLNLFLQKNEERLAIGTACVEGIQVIDWFTLSDEKGNGMHLNWIKKNQIFLKHESLRYGGGIMQVNDSFYVIATPEHTDSKQVKVAIVKIK